MGKHLPGGIQEGVPPERRDWFQEMSGVFKFSLSSLSEQELAEDVPPWWFSNQLGNGWAILVLPS